MANRKYTTEHIEYIAANIKRRSFKELTAMFNEQFKMSLGVSAMISLADRHGLHNERDTRLNTGWEPTQFKKGQVPWNKGRKGISYEGCKATQFPKGHKAWNWVPLGTERVNRDGYVDIKVADGQKQKNWRGKHIVLWEAAHGPIPEGHVVIFGDRNNRNFDLDNLILVSRKQLVRLNQNGLIKDDADLTRSGILVADLLNKIGERKKKK